MQSIASQTVSATALRSTFVAADSRADGAARQVWVGRQQISIRRRFLGIEMCVAVPTAAYTAVVLHAEDGNGACQVMLEHQDPDLSVTLWNDAGDAAVETVWQSWADYLQLPALRADAEPIHHHENPQDGSVMRRHRGVGAARRPRFLTRRKTGITDRMAIVHRDEELISYE